MSEKFKRVPAQLSERLAAELKAGTSLFQKPVKENGMPAFVTPINPITGKGYSAMNQIILAMRGHDDPRWMSADAASFNKMRVKEGAKGTLIDFPKKSEIQAIRTPDGAKIKNEDGLTMTRTVEFEKTQNGKAWLFNGSQIRDIEPLELFVEKQTANQPLSPVERAEKLIADSKAVIIHGGQEAYYDQRRDAIFLPEKEEFESEVRYYQEAIHQLAHWTGHESRLNRSMEGKFRSMDYAREEMRAAVAAMLIGGDLKIGHNFGPHAAYSSTFQKILREEPFEITRVARDAQKISALLLGVQQQREVKAETGIDAETEIKPEPEKKLSFEKGDVIDYMDTSYKVNEVKAKSIKVEDLDGKRTTIKSTDGLFKSLLEAKHNPVISEEMGQSRDTDLLGAEMSYDLER